MLLFGEFGSRPRGAPMSDIATALGCSPRLAQERIVALTAAGVLEVKRRPLAGVEPVPEAVVCWGTPRALAGLGPRLPTRPRTNEEGPRATLAPGARTKISHPAANDHRG